MNQNCEIGFGPHLTVDMYGCNKEKIGEIKFIYKILDEMPDLIGMTKISRPHVFLAKDNPNSFDRGGVSGFVLIAESHITIHTFPENKGHVFADVFSCKSFDVERPIAYLKDKFEAEDIKSRLFDRGLEFPRDVKVVSKVVAEERARYKKI